MIEKIVSKIKESSEKNNDIFSFLALNSLISVAISLILYLPLNQFTDYKGSYRTNKNSNGESLKEQVQKAQVKLLQNPTISNRLELEALTFFHDSFKGFLVSYQLSLGTPKFGPVVVPLLAISTELPKLNQLTLYDTWKPEVGWAKEKVEIKPKEIDIRDIIGYLLGGAAANFQHSLTWKMLKQLSKKNIKDS